VTAVPINPRVLIWARGERGLDTLTAADRLGWHPDELAAIEDGVQVPNVTQLRHMASKYGITFAALLMPEPLLPTTRLKVDDFRTLRSGQPRFGPDLLEVLDEVNLLIDGLADLREAAPAEFWPVELPVVTPKMRAEDVAARERKRLGLATDFQLGLSSPAEAFRHLRMRLEENGVFVYLMKAGSAEHWRGLAVYDERKIPVIVINGDEGEAAWRLFTLFHEYYHLLLRQTGIGDERAEAGTEVLCNQFAAHFLMPPERFIEEARALNPAEHEWTLRDARDLADRFHVSITAAAIHLQDVGLAQPGYASSVIAQLQRPAKRPGRTSGYYENMANRFGSRHFDVLFKALDAGVLDVLDVFELCTVKPKNLPQMRQMISERQAVYGRPS
jgi:Zn-dependent peptidase ImmA (M78 family)